jgi:imidazolonepropionase-like amidohydrolase
MPPPLLCRALLAVLAITLVPAHAGQTDTGLPSDRGVFAIHLLLHEIGTETYELRTNLNRTRTLTTTLDVSDRGSKRVTTATLTTTLDERPIALDIRGRESSIVRVNGGVTTLDIAGVRRTLSTPPGAAVIGATPFALQMMMMRAWRARGESKSIQPVSAEPDAEPLEIRRVGRDTVVVDGRSIALDRYTVGNLMFGREILWTNVTGELIAAMTFAGGLPMEAVRTDFRPALPHLYKAGVAQSLANLDAIGKAIPPVAAGDYAIAGATLVSATGEPPVPNSVVIVKGGRIVAVGPRASVPGLRGLTVVDGTGQTLLPGLWEMHTHASGVEFGPALLAAGVTTARDVGGEAEFLVAFRDRIARRGAIGPRLLLAGLVDAGGSRAFGHVAAENPDDGRIAVRRYHTAGFQQIKLYTYLSPAVVKAITEEAHRLGMTVTGHVPAALSAEDAIDLGVDQINHVREIMTMLRPRTARGEESLLDIDSATAQRAIRILRERRTVVDPVAAYGWMTRHPIEVDATSFEPALLRAPAVVRARLRHLGGALTPEELKTWTTEALSIIGALHKAGVPIVPGSDTGLVGFGLLREIEFFVQAGMTPMEAIQSATLVPARTMGLLEESGTIEVGKRADLILVRGDPLTDIRALRNVTRVVTNGQMYDASRLWRSVGFKPGAVN